MPKPIHIGIVGGGLMGREIASAFARWCALTDLPVTPVLTGVADTNPSALEWFRQIPTCTTLVGSHTELLANPELDVVYVAVPHHLHEPIYVDVIEAGKDLLAEKPFGIDLHSALRIRSAVEHSNQFVRCSSEFPFLPGPHRAWHIASKPKGLGRILEIVSGFHHASDLDPNKPGNWKRQSSTCGRIGVMGDLGMHACHLPLRLGWYPHRVFAQLQKGYPERPKSKNPSDGVVRCDTWDNALLNTWVSIENQDVPMRLEMKRLAPGETNTWFIEILGTDGGVRYSTKHPKTLWLFERDSNGRQYWRQTDLGFETPFKTVTGGIFEPGFPDAIQQMWAAFLLEREGLLGDRFGCATVDEAVATHTLFGAALKSQQNGTVQAVELPTLVG